VDHGEGGRERLVLVHHHPGRIRVRATIFRGDSPRDLSPDESKPDAATHASASVAAKALAALEAEPGVLSVVHRKATGSILIEYEPGHAEPDRIIARLADIAGLDGPLDDAEARRRADPPALIAIDVARELNEIAHELTGFRADLRSIIPAAMTGLAAYSFVTSKEPRLPRWDNLLWWSYSVFTQLHARDIDKRTQTVPVPENSPVADPTKSKS
jgi:hypothetical protein